MGRVGLVLGAGGAVGHAYHAGVLAALEAETGWRPDSAEVIVGTSAGSIAAAWIRAGGGAADLANASLGRPLSPAGRALLARSRQGARRPHRSSQRATAQRGPAAPHLLLRPWRVSLGTLGAALLPAGSVSTEAIASGVRNLYGEGWPDRPTWVCAVRLDKGRLIAFGRPGSPPASMAEAVAASCAIPAYFRPVVIDGVQHVDGGAHSVTNAGLLAGAGLDLVLVSCPMASARDALRLALDSPLRAVVGFQLAREAALVRKSGADLVSLLPTAADRTAMGSNPMDARRRKAVTAQAYDSTRARLADPRFRARLTALK